VVNALLEQVDGISSGREGIILIGASNDLGRCDPALLRAGRFNHIVKVSLPHPGELEKMLRVRLGSDLRDEDLRAVSELAIGMTGADIEKVVNDAKRVARQANRNLTISDLRQALVEEDNRPAELQFRSCVHEASHIIVDVIHNGPEDIFATAAVVGGHAGASVRTKLAPRAGTCDDYPIRASAAKAPTDDCARQRTALSRNASDRRDDLSVSKLSIHRLSPKD
jgi:cell division protease FtsH